LKTNPYPGTILLEEYLKPMGISQNAMARAVGVPPRAVNEIVLGRRSITPSMSIRFGAFFGQPDNFWSCLQMDSDFEALAKLRPRLRAGIQTAAELVGAKRGGPEVVSEESSGEFFDLPVENL
jgi:addiction module HigA family antidote